MVKSVWIFLLIVFLGGSTTALIVSYFGNGDAVFLFTERMRTVGAWSFFGVYLFYARLVFYGVCYWRWDKLCRKAMVRYKLAEEGVEELIEARSRIFVFISVYEIFVTLDILSKIIDMVRHYGS